MRPDTDFDVVVIGGGIVGLASAYQLAQRYPDVRLAVLEKEARVASHQTGHNSGVIHSGLYYRPGSSKAKTCAAGRQELIAFAKQHDIPHDICGKIIVATDPRELPAMERIFQNGLANDVEGIEKIGPEQIQQLEPAVAGIAGIRVPSAGIIAGGVECGSSAVFAFRREGYGKTDFSPRDTWESLSYPGTWLLFLRHWRYGMGEYARTFSKKHLVRQLQRLVPSLTVEDLLPGNSGLRAQALGPRGQLVDDFKIEATKNAIHVLNAPSPAATASLAIGHHIAQLAGQHFHL